MKWFRKRKGIWVRPLVQTFFFILIALIAVNHALAEGGGGISFLSSASLHALCPFGGVVTIYQYAAAGTFVQKIHESSFVLMLIGFVLAFLFGPVFCGWVCPLGTIQEWIGTRGRRLLKRRYNRVVPEHLDRILRYSRYLILGWVIYVTAVSSTLVFADYDPYFALFQFWTGEVAWTALAILGLTLILSLFVERPWCKYACPYGAVLGLTNLFRVFQIRRIAATCTLDGACHKMCPMNIDVSAKSIVRDHQCISCLECTSEAVCPVRDTVVFASGSLK